MELPDFRNLGEYDTVLFKTASGTLSSGLLGLVSGAVAATWQDVPAVQRNLAWPALQRTARVMGAYGGLFASVGGAFSLTDALACEVRGKRDIWNGVFGGLAAGGVVGLRAGSLPVTVGASLLLASVSALVDASGQVTRTDIGRDFVPYRKSGASPAE